MCKYCEALDETEYVPMEIFREKLGKVFGTEGAEYDPRIVITVQIKKHDMRISEDGPDYQYILNLNIYYPYREAEEFEYKVPITVCPFCGRGLLSYYVIHDAYGKFDEPQELLIFDNAEKMYKFVYDQGIKADPPFWYKQTYDDRIPFDVDLAKLSKAKGDHPYLWWRFDSHKNKEDIDVFETYEQLANAIK